MRRASRRTDTLDGRFKHQLVALANANRENITEDFATVQAIVDGASLVFGVFRDAAEPDGVGMLVVKGHALLREIVASGKALPVDMTAVPCSCAEQAEALRLVGRRGGSASLNHRSRPRSGNLPNDPAKTGRMGGRPVIEPETTAIVLKGAGHIENVRMLALRALEAGHRVVVTSDYNGDKAHVFTAVRLGTAFQVISVKGRSRHSSEENAIAAGMSAALDYLTWRKP